MKKHGSIDLSIDVYVKIVQAPACDVNCDYTFLHLLPYFQTSIEI